MHCPNAQRVTAWDDGIMEGEQCHALDVFLVFLVGQI